MISTKFRFLISHRGNITGPNPNTENTKKSIKLAIDTGYDCEIDVWKKDDIFYLGHDFPKEKVNIKFFLDFCNKLWVHCKNIEALYTLNTYDLNCFFHDKDDCTLTSKGYMWTYPGKLLTKKSICVLPEWGMDNCDISIACGVCSDYVERYANELR